MRHGLIIASAVLAGLCRPAFAVDSLTGQAIRDAVQFRQKAEVANNLRRITAYYLGESGGCANVAVETSERRGRTAYSVCGDAIEERGAMEPAPPNDDPNYRRTVVATGKRALMEGSAIGRFEGYLVQARRTGWPDGNGCGIIEIIVTFDGLLVDSAQPRVCP